MKINFLYVLFFLDILNIAVFLPVFSAFVKSLGGTPSTLGIINSSSALISFLWNPIVGSLSDQIGRKGLLIKCLLASCIGSIVMASSSSLILVFIGRLIGSLGSPVGILLRSVVADTYKTPEEKKAFFNKSAPLLSIGFLIGSVSSGFLSEAKNGYSLAFLLMGAIMGTATVVAKQSLQTADKTTSGKGKKKQKQPFFLTKSFLELKRAALDIKTINWPRYKNLFMIKASYEFALAIITSSMGFIIVDEFNIKGRYMGYVFLMISMVSIGANLLKLKLKSWFDRMPDRQIVFKGDLVLTASFFGMAISNSALTYFFFVGVMCVARTILDTVHLEMITIETDEDDRGKVLGAFENLVPLFGFIVPATSGFMAEAYGYRVLTMTALIPMTVTLYFANKLHDKRN